MLAVGIGTLTYQWRQNGALIPNATNAVLTLNNVQLSLAGLYTVDVVNASTNQTSQAAQLVVVPPPPPGITVQPSSRTVAVNSSVTISVVATGAPPVSYQWRLSNTNLPGATTNTFALLSAQFSNAGAYTIVVSNPGGSVTSAPAILTVMQPPAFTLQPQSQIITAGSNVTFSVAASGSSPLFLQWTRNGTNLPNATNATLTLTNVQIAQAGSYQAWASNAVGTALSDTATLIVPYPITITSQPQGQSVFPYASVIFSVGASGSSPLGYQWRLAGTNLPGATNISLVKPSVLPADAGSYTVVITNTISAVTSAPALLTVFTSPTILQQPQSRSASAGSNATFTVVASSSTPLRYQWYFNTNATLAGATNDSYSIAAVASNHYGFYNVQVFDSFGSTWSDSAQLAEKLKPTITAQPTPTNSAALLGSALTLCVSAFGPQPLYFVWQRNGGLVTNSMLFDTNSILVLTNLALAQAGSYTVTVSNIAGSALPSGRAYVTMMTPLTNQNAWAGSNVAFSFQACSSYPNAPLSTNNYLRYQWWFNQTNLVSTVTNLRATFTNVVLNLTNVQAAHEGNYSVILTNANGLATTQSATLTVLRAPSITRQPGSQTVFPGASASFSVLAEGGALSYQWYFGPLALGGATNSMLNLPNTQSTDAGGYRVVVTNAAGSVTSDVAVLTVEPYVLTGQVELEDYARPTLSRPATRIVTFTATDADNNFVATWNLALDFSPGPDRTGMATFTIVGAPPTTFNLSAKTAWHLRKRLPVVFIGLEAALDFAGDSRLPTGDLDGSNMVDLGDYYQLAAAWYTSDSAADIDGSGLVDIFDYFLLSCHWHQTGDPE